MRFALLLTIIAGMVLAMTCVQAADVTLKRAGHPRLTMARQELRDQRADPAVVKAAALAGESVLQKTKTTSYMDCFATLPAPPTPAPHPYNKAWPYWTGVCSEIRSYLEAVARGWAVGGDRKCYDAALSTMLALANWKQWTDPDYGSEPCLDTFSLTRGMALAYDLLYEDLKPEDRATICKAIVEKGCEFIYTAGQNRTSYVSQPKAWPNGFAVVNTAMGIGGMAVLDDSPGAGKYVSGALARMDQFFTEVAGADGGLVEGFGYGSFAIDNFTDLILQAHDVCGIDAMRGDYLQHAILFPAYFTLPGGGPDCLPAIGDNGNTNGCPPTLIGLAKALVAVKHDSVAAWYLERAGHGDEASRRLARPPDDLPFGRRFSSINWVSLRDGWGDSGALMAFKCGEVDHHNHLDQNHFVLGWDREWIINDPGYQIYDMDYPPERHMDRDAIRHMHAYTAGTEGHNSILVDGQGQNGKAGSVPEFFSSPAMQWTVGDATACYDTLTRFRRSVLQVPGRYFLIYDDIAAKAPAQIEFSLHTTPTGQFVIGGTPSGTPMAIDAVSDARSFLIRGTAGQVAVDLLAPAKTTITHKVWPDSKDYGHFVAVAAEKAASQEDAFVLRPGPLSDAVAPLSTAMTLLRGRARYFRIGVDNIIINPEATAVRSEALATTGTAALASDDSGILRYALVNGTRLSAARELVSADAPVSVGARVQGKALVADIEAAEDAVVILYSPLHPGLVSLNGIEHPVNLSFDPAAKTVRLHIPAGHYQLKITEL